MIRSVAPTVRVMKEAQYGDARLFSREDPCAPADPGTRSASRARLSSLDRTEEGAGPRTAAEAATRSSPGHAGGLDRLRGSGEDCRRRPQPDVATRLQRKDPVPHLWDRKPTGVQV